MSSQQASADAIADVRYRMRHSAAHVMAEAVIKSFGGKLTIDGPDAQDGVVVVDLPAPS